MSDQLASPCQTSYHLHAGQRTQPFRGAYVPGGNEADYDYRYVEYVEYDYRYVEYVEYDYRYVEYDYRYVEYDYR